MSVYVNLLNTCFTNLYLLLSDTHYALILYEKKASFQMRVKHVSLYQFIKHLFHKWHKVTAERYQPKSFCMSRFCFYEYERENGLRCPLGYQITEANRSEKKKIVLYL